MAKLRIKAVNMNKQTEFIPKSERGEDNPVTFILKPLSYNQRERCAALATESFDLASLEKVKGHTKEGATPDIKDAFKLVNSTSQAARFALTSWKNLFDEDGNEVSFPGLSEYNGAKEEALDLLPFDIVQELGQFVLGNNKADEDDLKN